MKNKQSLGGAVAIVLGPAPKHETALVCDEKRRDPKWKFAGGGTEHQDKFVFDPTVGGLVVTDDEKLIAIITAWRELEEETGLIPHSVRWVGRTYRSDKKGYTHYVFVDVADFASLKERGNEGEHVRVCTFEEIFSGEIDFLKYHKDFLDLHLKA